MVRSALYALISWGTSYPNPKPSVQNHVDRYPKAKEVKMIITCLLNQGNTKLMCSVFAQITLSIILIISISSHRCEEITAGILFINRKGYDKLWISEWCKRIRATVLYIATEIWCSFSIQVHFDFFMRTSLLKLVFE